MTAPPGDASASFEAFVVTPGYEDAVERALDRLRFPSLPRAPRWPGLVTRPGFPAVGDVDVVFARQWLPAARLVRAPSVQSLADAAIAAVLEPLITPSHAPPGHWFLHVFSPEPDLYRSLAGRRELLESAFVARLKAARRALLRRLEPLDSRTQAPPSWPDGQLVQLALVGRSSLLVSVARPRPLASGGTDLAPWPAGVAPVAEDRTAPSRAYGKLEEALAWFGRHPSDGERVVDLGGSPGGWAWTALKYGAYVTAVDRAPLAPPAAGHPRFTFVNGNAFTYAPAEGQEPEWLLCDVICEPQRTLELVARWFERRWCTHAVASVKFKGAAQYHLLDDALARLRAAGAVWARIKHMRHNRNEVELMASRLGAPESSATRS